MTPERKREIEEYIEEHNLNDGRYPFVGHERQLVIFVRELLWEVNSLKKFAIHMSREVGADGTDAEVMQEVTEFINANL